ncbi:MAG: hypothetical protein JXR37_37075 [Kiritimatiellae bacterium]|nr:hypothetical protein [Kiritimatiellia bacterium]
MNRQPATNWWGRNWKWFVPVACVVSFVLFVGLIAAFMFFVLGMMKSCEAYKVAVAKAEAHPSVLEALGAPLKEGAFIAGSINESGASGRAELSIPISGPRGKGIIHVVAARSGGEWAFSTLVVEFEATGQRINLLE